MRWVDVAGPPGCGKSTLCYPLWGDKSVTWDGKLPPAYWKPFLDEMTCLMALVHDHPSFEAVLRMNERSVKKMATVERLSHHDIVPWLPSPRGPVPNTFIQTGLMQRILGFGWRLKHLERDVNLIRTALWYMPVSVGVAFLEATDVTIMARNKARESVKETAHENRAFQVPLMREAISIAKEVLDERGVNVVSIDVEHQSIERARQQLIDFAGRVPGDLAALGRGSEMALLQAPPFWWRS